MGSHLLESNDVITRLHVGDALTNRLNNTGTLVSQDDGEGTFWVLAGQCVGICVANTCVVDLDTDFVGFRRGDLNVLDGQVLASLPGNGGLASDGLVKEPLASHGPKLLMRGRVGVTSS